MIVPLVLTLSLVSPAAPKKPIWVPLVHVQGDVPASWPEALRKAVTDSERTWVAPPAVTLEEAQIALGCAGWSDTCAGQITSMTGATMALVIDVVAQGDGALVTVQQVKGGGGLQGTVEKLELPGRRDEDLEVASLFVRRAFRPTAVVLVDADTPGADVLIDGQKVGRTPAQLILDPGEHELSLRLEGKAPYTRRITLKPGQNPPEMITLNATGIAVAVSPSVGNETHEVRTTAPTPPPTADGLPTHALVGWSLAGAGALVAVGAIGVGAPWLWDVYFNTVPCGPEKIPCMPMTVKVYGAIEYDREARGQFVNDAGTIVSASVAALGVGGLLIGTGVVLATAEAGETAGETADAAAAAGR